MISIFVLYGLAMAVFWLSLADISTHLDLYIKLDSHVSYILVHSLCINLYQAFRLADVDQQRKCCYNFRVLARNDF